MHDRVQVVLDRALLDDELAPASTSTSRACCASAASVRPGTSANRPTRCSATTRSIVDSVMRRTGGRSRATSSSGRERPEPVPGRTPRPG